MQVTTKMWTLKSTDLGGGERVNNMLRGRIVERFKTITAFAAAIGWSPRKAFDIVNGKQEPSARDIENMAKALQIEIPSELHSLFFS